ncbi:MAG: hypothetical protein JWN44_6602 [Myxococcales bacterium]|nr:hypothetical protein [Myxococcales bacterium]
MRAWVMMAALLAPATAMAATAEDYGEDAEGYCAFANAVANSESSILFSPSLFLDYGVVNGNDLTSGSGGAIAGPPAHRLTIGARYSLVGLLRGVTNKQRASADCDRYRASSGLARFLVENREQVSPSALDAKLAILHAARNKALAIVKDVRAAVERQRATVEELQAVEVKVDELEVSTTEAEAQRAGLPSRSSVASPGELLRRHREADNEVERYEGRLRVSQAFDLSIRGGYDRFFGLRDDNPYFVVMSLSINPAAVYQAFAESDATKARARAVRMANDGVEQKADLLIARLRALHAGEKRRLVELRTLLADVEGRLRSLDAIEGEKLRRFRDATWFDWVRLKSEHEFLRVHVAELTQTLGGDGG